MSACPSVVPNPIDQRGAAYTTPRPDVFEMVPVSARQILDVGCSNGALGRSLLAGRSDRNVCGIEFDPTFATEAANHLDYVVTADLNLLDFDEALADRRFDCIIFADVLEHLIEPRHCLVQASRFLRPGGCVVVSLPNIRHLSALLAIFLSGRFPQRDRGIFDRTHMRWFTIADAYALLSGCGLQVSSMGLALRWGDRGGGRLNRLLNALPKFVQQWAPVREFLTYQLCLRAEVRP
ncbi:class I SAM-dependent methyltransferase [Rhodoferax sp.]|uniref:class I SAM-dependent methyltransferase n=1 Tax=Rhodoferax sp. TaxID=50421 RepID=UPI0027756729|nr:class I SAM-dependent methyltransferase [Rhodoferax sp.]